MGDGLKLSKDKRHRSSSSIAGVAVEGTRSERKLDIKGDSCFPMVGSILEVEDQFALADARCDHLQEKIDLVKVVKRKKKLKKRSTTRVNEQPLPPENVPFISVRTQPKKKAVLARLRGLETAPNPVRGYVDPVTVEQHRMLGQVHGYSQSYNQAQSSKPLDALNTQNKNVEQHPMRYRRARADGDTMYGRGAEVSAADLDPGAIDADFSDSDVFDQRTSDFYEMHKKKPVDHHQERIPISAQRMRQTNDVPLKEGKKWASKTREQEAWRMMPPATRPRRQPSVQVKNKAPPPAEAAAEERPVVELFNKSRDSMSPLPTRSSTYADKLTKKVRETQRYEDETTGNLEQVSTEALKKNKETGHPHKVKYRSRRYELPTVASQMKQAGVRYYYGTGNHSNIPFIVSKSTAPSHNIGVNIQQVLNGLKIQQPLSGIPPTLAHHMGLGYIPTHGTKSATVHPPLEQREINAIKLGRRLVRLPSYKYISYNRMLNLYREGDGMVPRFLRAISRPHYFYTSMYNLATNREDLDGATSKGNVRSQAAKQSLAEYTSLYREYEQLEKCLKEGNYEPEWERRRDELSRELAAREEHIRRVVQDYRTSSEGEPGVLRASASNAEDGCRRVSSFKLNLDPQQ